MFRLQRSVSRSRWAAIGAAIAVSVGGGGLAITHATVSSGERDVFVPIAPCRLFDLRPAPDQIGPRGTALTAGETYTQPVRGAVGNCNVPNDATAVAMNVTAVGGTANSFLTIWPSDVGRPLASSLNWTPGSPPTPNKVDVKLSVADGSISLFNQQGSVFVLADVVGYYADHNFDDRYYTKTQSDAQLGAKANASDVYTKTQINGMPMSSVVAGGAVNGDGTISSTFPRFGSTWTVTHTASSGAYSLQMPGLNPGCAVPLVPLIEISANQTGAGFQGYGGFAVINCGSGDTTMSVNTYNQAGTAADRAFVFIAYRPGNGQVLPAVAAEGHPGATTCTVYPDGTVNCV